MLKRELAEFGVGWHGCDWGTHQILGKNGLDSSIRLRSGDPMSNPLRWKWEEPQPAEWEPQVIEEDGKVTVVFYSFSDFAGSSLSSYRQVWSRRHRYKLENCKSGLLTYDAQQGGKAAR